ncbi:MAG: hypothetical protein GYB68_19050 [Chloroflexi bacterium]|nr:hypothetical protein [Chloroflexota bacterium]
MNAKSREFDATFLIGAGLIVLGILFLLNQIFGGFLNTFVWMAILGAGSAGFLAVYGRSESNWWALIPAYVLAAIVGLLALDMIFPTLTAPYVQFAIALPFFYVYLRNRSNWWALIPGGIMALIGIGLLIDSLAWLFPIALIGVGVFLLARQFTGTKSETPAAAQASANGHNGYEPIKVEPQPISGPEADKPRV